MEISYRGDAASIISPGVSMNVALISKKEAWEEFRKLMDSDVSNKSAWHFGRMEMAILLEKIYGRDRGASTQWAGKDIK